MAHVFTTSIREAEVGEPREFQSTLGYKIRSSQHMRVHTCTRAYSHTHTHTHTRQGKKKRQRDRETEIEAERQRQRKRERQRHRERRLGFHFKRFSVLLSTGKWTLKL